MKRIFALILVLLLAFSLVACGNNDTNKDNETLNDPGQTQSPENSETGDDTTNDAPAFDTSWAANDFEAMLPKLPFEGWETSQPAAGTYKMSVSGLNTSPATNAPDSGEPDGADKEKLKDYLATLPGYGFTLVETGTDYMWEATDTNGNKIEFMCGDGGCFITIEKANP